MNHAPSNAAEACEMPPAAADAWAAVYIDVSGKLDAEERGQQTPADSEPQHDRQGDA